VLQLLGRPDRILRGSCSLKGCSQMAGAAIGTVWRRMAAQPLCISVRVARMRAAWRKWWRGIPACISIGGVRWGCCLQWAVGHVIQSTARATR